MAELSYSTAVYIDQVERAPGYHDVRARLVWTPRDGGDERVVVGEYLDADGVGGAITLGCGIDGAAADLGLEGLVLSRGDDYLLALCDIVDRQLAAGPRARLVCPEGVLDIAVLPWG